MTENSKVLRSAASRWQAARDAIGGATVGQDHAFVAFSGGKESVILAHLADAAEVPFSLLWSNTGFNFPHVEEFIREQGKHFDLIEVSADLPGQWKRCGLPSDLLSVRHAKPGNAARQPRLQTWAGCCWENRIKPMVDHLASVEGRSVLVHGQRSADGAPGLGLSGIVIPNVTVCAPLADWSEGEVFEYARAHDLRLPSHYDEIADSLDCWACPALFSDEIGHERAAFMTKRYPDLARVVLPGLRTIHRAIGDELRWIGTAAAGLEAEGEEWPIVHQRTDEDCAIAALATAARRSYEEAAQALGCPCNGTTGLPSIVPGRGIHYMELPAALIRIGLAGSIVASNHGVTAAAGPSPLYGISPEELRDMIAGRPAVLVTLEPDRGRFHAVAWTGRAAIDCRDGSVPSEVVPLLCAIIITGQVRAC